jgi:hypothetical protein
MHYEQRTKPNKALTCGYAHPAQRTKYEQRSGAEVNKALTCGYADYAAPTPYEQRSGAEVRNRPRFTNKGALFVRGFGPKPQVKALFVHVRCS